MYQHKDEKKNIKHKQHVHAKRYNVFLVPHLILNQKKSMKNQFTDEFFGCLKCLNLIGLTN